MASAHCAFGSNLCGQGEVWEIIREIVQTCRNLQKIEEITGQMRVVGNWGVGKKETHIYFLWLQKPRAKIHDSKRNASLVYWLREARGRGPSSPRPSVCAR